MSANRLEQLLALIKENPEDPFLKFALAKEYEKRDNQDQALFYYLDLEKNTPDYVGTYYHLGKLYEKLGEPAKAFRTYQDGINVAQKIGDQHSLSELAGAKLSLGDEEDFT